MTVEMLRLPSLHRHEQPGYFSLSQLPQRSSIAEYALSPGWWELEQIWKLYPGQFNVVTGVAGHGKSTFLLNVICNLAKQYGTRSFLYVPENEAHLRRKVEAIWGSAEGFNYFCENQCYVQSAVPDAFDQEPRTLTWVLNRAIVAIEEDHAEVLLIDPWNELERAKPRDMLMTDYIGQCLMWLKQFCRSWQVIVILVAHPTKAGVDNGKVPSLSDIEGSMNWMNKCDNGLIVVRDPEKSTARVISAKVREHGAGRRGVCHFQVDEATGVFTPMHGAVTP